MSRKDKIRTESPNKTSGVSPGIENIQMQTDGNLQENPVWTTVPDIITGKRSKLEKITVNELIWKMREKEDTESEQQVMFNIIDDEDDDGHSGSSSSSNDSGGSSSGGFTPSSGSEMSSYGQGDRMDMITASSLFVVMVNEKVCMETKARRHNNMFRMDAEKPVPFASVHW
ncbi:hypothetical protein KKF34_19150 [Myxococcota bacterium]|nr:hypothetical protein [Myxococcota bacterium]MBU1379270.1 hypothetical protein [Myxococcota bacterium]MBU1499006.1 hypothetical protein [Myxococcota bacterium]